MVRCCRWRCSLGLRRPHRDHPRVLIRRPLRVRRADLEVLPEPTVSPLRRVVRCSILCTARVPRPPVGSRSRRRRSRRAARSPRLYGQPGAGNLLLRCPGSRQLVGVLGGTSDRCRPAESPMLGSKIVGRGPDRVIGVGRGDPGGQVAEGVDVARHRRLVSAATTSR
jgi:hypothetical protein